MKIKIIVATHKIVNFPKSAIFTPIHVGRAIRKNIGYMGDNTGDNISERVSTFSELPALYWMWKNLEGYDYLGFCQYRRYFIKNKVRYNLRYKKNILFKKIRNLFKENKKIGVDNKTKVKGLKKLPKLLRETENYLKKTLSKYDVVLLKEYSLSGTIKDLYVETSHSSIRDFEVLRNIISEKYSDYLAEYDNCIEKNKLSPANMFIAKSNILKEYSEWLFDILFEAEKRIEVSENLKDKRIFGFMAEYLLNIYFNYHKNDYKILRMEQLYIRNIN